MMVVLITDTYFALIDLVNDDDSDDEYEHEFDDDYDDDTLLTIIKIIDIFH